MAVLINAYSAITPATIHSPLPLSSSSLLHSATKTSSRVAPLSFSSPSSTPGRFPLRLSLAAAAAAKNELIVEIVGDDETREQAEERCWLLEDEEEKEGSTKDTLLYSFSPLPLLFLATLPGATTVRSVFGPIVELVKSLSLPDWLVHWGHPGNMAVVLFAMGGYGTYLGFRIRFSDDAEEKAKAKDLHPKLLAGMFFFFALGATGGVISLLTSDKPIFESPHAVTGIIGLALLTIQTILPTLFEGNSGLRNVHGLLGSGIMTLFLVHAVLGLQLGLSY